MSRLRESFNPAAWRWVRTYDPRHLVGDIGAGVAVGVIALPLAIGFAIASGVEPWRGLWAAIIGGLIISLFGGSRFQTALAGILMAVALRMAEWDTFGEVWRASRSDFGVLAAAFVLTVVFDLTVGVGAGLAAGG